MGSGYSRASDNNSCSFENVPDSSSSSAEEQQPDPGSIYDLDPLSEEVETYEAEFKKTCRRVSNVVESFGNIPCREASAKIVACLRENPNQMGHCLHCMSSYRMCVWEATANKLNQFAYEIKT